MNGCMFWRVWNKFYFKTNDGYYNVVWKIFRSTLSINWDVEKRDFISHSKQLQQSKEKRLNESSFPHISSIYVKIYIICIWATAQYYMKCVNESVAIKAKEKRPFIKNATLSQSESTVYINNIKNQPIYIYVLHHFISLTHSRNIDLEIKILFKKCSAEKREK